MSATARASVLGTCLALAGCAGLSQRTAPPPTTATCEPGDRPMLRDMLYFGQGLAGDGASSATVSDAQWQAFVDNEITPRFPDGLTIVKADGQWRGVDGKIRAEPSRLLILLHEGEANQRAAIRAIVDAYKQRFQQESVLRERSAVCAAL